MAFQLQVSNSLNQLAERLCADLRSAHKDVFQPVYIITQTDGMNNWLKLQIAHKIGIAANCQFLKPNDLINKIYYLLDGSASQTLSAENLNWLLFKLLNEEDFVQKYPAIAAYYKNDEPDKEVKRMALAQKVGDLFDQYQIYRADMIQQWNDHSFIETGEDEWQKYLWVNAKKMLHNFPDKTVLREDIEKGLSNPKLKEKLQQKMPVIYLFGISLITEYHLQLFQELAKSIDIHFLLLNPAPAVFWFDDKSEKQLAFLKKIGKIENTATSLGNPLLTGWGKIIQDTFSLLFKNEELINAYEDLEAVAPMDDSLLHKIQLSIFENEPINESALFSTDEILDGSITINSCYSPAREVEALYNFFVYLADKKEEPLSPREIVVMVSDIDQYASYIKAIFNNAPYKFRYTIADESYASSDSISNALHAILSITEDNFTGEEVVRLLDSSFIRKRFNITDTSLIRNVVNDANIRFGMNGNKEDDSVYISWQYGLQRIMYGICMAGSEEFNLDEETESFYPQDMVEGSAAHEVIRFVHFAEQLMASLKERKKANTIEGWVKYVEDILHGFICSSEDTTDEDYLLLLKQLENYNSITEFFIEAISYEVFMHTYLATIINATKNSSFAVGGITFCSLIPMRSIPFKVVALLGLNFDKFPRRENSTGFNLMEKEKRKGDRNVKENDKHLFLETLLSAKDHLYISYIGQSVKDNSNIPPSTLVDELVDYISTSAEAPKKVREQIITRQPLHGFSAQYDGGDDKLYSYLRATKPAVQMVQKEKNAEAIPFAEINLDHLVSFLKNPFKGYYNKVLGIYYREDEIILRDTELFELNGLQQWGLKNDLLLIDGANELTELKNKLIKTGALPLKNMAEIEIQNIEAAVTASRDLFKNLVGTEEEANYFVDIEVGLHKLKGMVKGIYGNKFVIISWSKSETKYLLDAYIKYLALLASGQEITLHFISCHKEKVFDATIITTTQAAAALQQLLKLYVEGHEQIITFDPYFNIKHKEINDLTAELFSKVLKDKFENFLFPCNDTYMNKEYANGFFDTADVVENCKAAGVKLLTPLTLLFPTYYL